MRRGGSIWDDGGAPARTIDMASSHILENSNAWTSIALDAYVDGEGVPADTPKTSQKRPADQNTV